MALTAYLTATQNLLGTGAAQNLYTNTQLTSYINEGRAQIAADGQCIRVLPTISGSISAITVSSGGSGYNSAPLITISGPDSPPGFLPNPNGLQATAVATVTGGSVTTITVLSAGAGYFNPLVTITGSGTGASAVAITTAVNTTLQGQEVYPYSVANALVATSGSGISRIIAVNSISVIWGVWRYMYMRSSFSVYQAHMRTYAAGGFQYIPAVFTQFAQGDQGTVYMYPVPNANYAMEWDVFCLPNPLVTDADPEALPYPWTDVVPYYAAYKAFLQNQRFNDAEKMFSPDPRKPGLYQVFMHRARRMSNPSLVSNRYGRRP